MTGSAAFIVVRVMANCNKINVDFACFVYSAPLMIGSFMAVSMTQPFSLPFLTLPSPPFPAPFPSRPALPSFPYSPSPLSLPCPSFPVPSPLPSLRSIAPLNPAVGSAEAL